MCSKMRQQIYFTLVKAKAKLEYVKKSFTHKLKKNWNDDGHIACRKPLLLY